MESRVARVNLGTRESGVAMERIARVNLGTINDPRITVYPCSIHVQLISLILYPFYNKTTLQARNSSR